MAGSEAIGRIHGRADDSGQAAGPPSKRILAPWCETTRRTTRRKRCATSDGQPGCRNADGRGRATDRVGMRRKADCVTGTMSRLPPRRALRPPQPCGARARAPSTRRAATHGDRPTRFAERFSVLWAISCGRRRLRPSSSTSSSSPRACRWCVSPTAAVGHFSSVRVVDALGSFGCMREGWRVSAVLPHAVFVRGWNWSRTSPSARL